jgi:tetratricopeptide repeat protein 30
MFIFFQSRAALSLLGYCYFQMQDFVNASDCYEQLSLMHPEVEDYKLYYSQSLYKACLYQEGMKVACQIDNPEYQGKVSLYRPSE